jgi:hypothetical protein
MASANSVAAPIAESVGLTPVALVLADVSATSASALLDAIEDSASLITTIESKESAYSSAADAYGNAQADLHADPLNESVEDAYNNAAAALATAETELNVAKAALYAAAVSSLTQSQQDALEVVRVAEGINIPDAFRVLSRTADEWRELEQFLRMEGRLIRRGVTVPSAVADLLEAVRSDEAVVAAQSRIDSSLVAMQSIFDQYSE